MTLAHGSQGGRTGDKTGHKSELHITTENLQKKGGEESRRCTVGPKLGVPAWNRRFPMQLIAGSSVCPQWCLQGA